MVDIVRNVLGEITTPVEPVYGRNIVLSRRARIRLAGGTSRR